MPVLDAYGFYKITDENLEQYPEHINNWYVENPPQEGLIHLFIPGDMHASTLKALHFVVRNNFIHITKNDFDDFVRIFKALHTISDLPLDTEYTDEMIKKDLARLREIMSSIKGNPLVKGKIKVPFAGDNFSDRAGLDFLNAMFYHRLGKIGIEMELDYRLTFSNHDSEFLRAYEQGLKPSEEGLPFLTRLTHPLAPGQEKSLQNTGVLLQKGLIEKEEIDEYMQSILPHYRAIDYSLMPGSEHIEFISHAGTDLSIVWHMANYLRSQLEELLNDDEKLLLDSMKPLLEALKKTYELSKDTFFGSISLNVKDLSLAIAYAINVVNQISSRLIVSGHTTQLLGPSVGVPTYAVPFQFAAWNRKADILYRPEYLAGCSFHYIHGHDPAFEAIYPVTNLDFNNAIGRPNARGELQNNGSYPYYFLPNQLPEQQVEAKLQLFNVEEFVLNAEEELKRIQDLIAADCDKTVEFLEERSDEEEGEEESEEENVIMGDDPNPKKRASNNADPSPSSKRLKFFVEESAVQKDPEENEQENIAAGNLNPISNNTGQTAKGVNFFSVTGKQELRRTLSDGSLLNNKLNPLLDDKSTPQDAGRFKRNNSCL